MVVELCFQALVVCQFFCCFCRFVVLLPVDMAYLV